MRKLRMEPLEPKDLLYNFSGFEVFNPESISYSFVNGPYMNSDAVEVASTLDAHLAGCDDPDRQIARALQQWSDIGPFNFRKVADSGLPVPQRFQVLDEGNHGNIAITHFTNQGSNDPPYIAQGLPPTTINGKAMDINLRGGMCGTPDRLFGVVRHEVGHTLGFYHSSGGVMAGNGGLNLPVIDADTIAGVHAVYGERQHDQYDAAQSNDTWATPTAILDDLIIADLTTPQDLDIYVVRAESTQISVTVAAAGSLVAPVVGIYDGSGLADAAADDYAGSATATIETTPGNWYGVLANNASGPFAVGRYSLQVEHGGGGSAESTVAARALAIDYAIEESRWDLERLQSSSAANMRR